MPFKAQFSKEFKSDLSKILKKDKARYEIIIKKIEEITSRDINTIDFYKNLKHALKEYKRAHIDKSFVMLFKAYKNENTILFEKIKHHDDVYK
ncbi:MAG: addiction module toxin RelE [archaeon]|nr:addiction module toxin RelE [archaeon]